MTLPKEEAKHDEIVLEDDTIIAGNMPDEGEETEKEKEKVDDATKDKVSKKEEEANLRMTKLEEGNTRLMKIFTSPDFFAKMASSMKPPPAKEVVTKATPAEVNAEKERLEGLSRFDFQRETLDRVGKATTDAIKPEIEMLAGKISAFISGQANVTAKSALGDFIDRAGQAEFDKYGAAMEAKANTVKGVSIDEIYTLVSGKIAPKRVQQVIPNSTVKPGEGTKEITKPLNLTQEEAGSRNFDQIFGKYKK